MTAFCRRHGIGHEPPKPTGHYHFEPGQEMQHDTSPHVAHIGGAERNVQTASLVLCHSRMVFMQLYPRFTRFHCKVFLTEALQYIGGACTHCMIDNTHVVVLRGTGKEMVPVPEMEAFATRLGFGSSPTPRATPTAPPTSSASSPHARRRPHLPDGGLVAAGRGRGQQVLRFRGRNRLSWSRGQSA